MRDPEGMSQQVAVGRAAPERKTRTVEIEVDAGGRGSVVVNGKDVSPVITGLTFELHGGAVPEVVLYGGGTGGIAYQGPAYITLGDQPATGPDPEQIVAWLQEQAEDDELEQALVRGSLESSPATAFMAELIRRARE